MPHNLGLILALTLTGAIWALTFPMTKIAVLGGYRSFGIIFWSSVIAALALGAIVRLRGLGLPLHRAAVARYVFVALVGTVLPSAATYTAAEHLPAGVIAVCMAIIPIVAFPMAIAVGQERPNVLRFLGLLLGFLGVLMIVLPDASLPDPTQAVFIILALASVLFYAIEGVGLGKIGRAESATDMAPMCGHSGTASSHSGARRTHGEASRCRQRGPATARASVVVPRGQLRQE